MNDTGLPSSARPSWPLRLGIAIQHVAELVILGVVLIAVCIAACGLPPWIGIFGTPDFLAWLASSSIRHFHAVVGGAIVLIPLAWLAYRNFWIGPGARLIQQGLKKPVLGISILGVLIVAAVYLYLWPKMFPGLSRSLALHSGDVSLNWADTQSAIAFIALSIPIMLTRICRKPLHFFLAVIIISGLFLGYQYFKAHKIILVIMREFNSVPQIARQDILKPGIMISVMFMPLRLVLEIIIPFLMALYAIRRGFAWWKVLLGWGVGWLLAYAILFLSTPPVSRAAFMMVATNLVLVFLLLRMPRQRQALENLTGLILTRKQQKMRAAQDHGALASLLGYGLLGILAVGLVAFSIIGTYEKRMAQLFPAGLPAPRYSPVLVNAFDIMKPWFDKQNSKPLDCHMSDDYVLLEMLGGGSRPLMEEIKSLIDPAKIEDNLNLLKPALDLYVRAAGADYWLFQEPGRAVTPHYVNLRIVARALLVSANLHIMQDRPADALKDIETNLKIAWLINGDPNGFLVSHMVAVAIRGIANAAAQNYFHYYRQNPEALEQLRAMLERDARLVRFDFPSESVARTEPGFWPVVPYFEVIVPGLVKAGAMFYQRWADYDVIFLATALEAFRRDQGRYPDRLEQLVPKHIARLPREPIEGKPYIYANLGSDFRLSYHVPGDARRIQIDFSTIVKENSAVQKSLERLKAPMKPLSRINTR